MDFAILGPLEVRADGRDLDLGPPKQRALLAALLLQVNQVVAVDRLIESVWGDDPPRTAGHSVQIYVSELRKCFVRAGEQPVITTRSPGYVAVVEPETVDAYRFERLVTLGSDQLRSGDAATSAQTLRCALAMWRGPPLADFTYAEFAQPHIRRLDELRSNAVEELAAALLRLGRAPEALAELSPLLETQPLREHGRQLQLLALYRCGRQAEALRTYDEVRRRLADELGLDPSPALQQLQGRILLQDASLTPAGSSSNGTAVGNPFKGLRAFTEADAADFFGRHELVDQLCGVLSGGARLVAVVGPSGSGKSSVTAAGLIPALRGGAVEGSEHWPIASMVPGEDPAKELTGALAAASDEPAASAPAGSVVASAAAVSPASATPTLLVIDQFEELFTRSEEEEAVAFLSHLSDALDAGGGLLRVIVALRADFYDRPLLHREFAPWFTRHVINVLPLSAGDLEVAASEPANRVGVEIEPALLAELVADATGQPGALPLFQFTITELFEQRDGGPIALRSYRRLGGLHGALSRRAEDIYAALTPDQQHIAEQVFLRLVTPGEGTRDVRRRATAREIGDLELDPVDLADVLDRFGRHRLLTFDRDPLSGDATIEVAHEALFEAWSRYRGWIDHRRSDLRHRERLSAAVAEWTASGHEEGYLLSGSRLDQYVSWSERTTLLLTADSQAFLQASREQDRALEQHEAARRAHEARLRARARGRLWALFAAAVLLAAVTTALLLASVDQPPADVALFFDGDRENVISQMVLAGGDQAAAELDLEVEQVGAVTDAQLHAMAEQDVALIIFPVANLLDDHGLEHPDTHYAVLHHGDGRDADDRPNVTYIDFAEQEGSFLVGAAAAMKTESGRIGFIGGMADLPLIERFQAGFEAGARYVDPAIEIDSVNLSRWPDDSGFNSPTLAARAATDLYRAGADVVYHASGRSGFGLLETVVAESQRQGRHLWAIGVDVDEYLNDHPRAVLGGPRLWDSGPDDWKPHILTSMVKQLDVAVYHTIVDFHREGPAPGVSVFDLANGGIDYATSGGFVDDIVPELEELKQAIIAGRIEVPTTLAEQGT
jgi:basic membrane lipoprotein Med (substrate-binding protein (PBP1-ABC) superfamily)/DNA-binding SARP family transcriptional activator